MNPLGVFSKRVGPFGHGIVCVGCLCPVNIWAFHACRRN